MTENLFPYELPENWHWTTLGEIAKIFTGNSINEKIKQEKYFGRTNGIIYIATKDVGFDKKINYDTKIKIPESENFKIAPKNTTLLCIEGGSAGKKIGFTNQPVCFVNKLCAFVGNEINSKLIYFFMQTDFFLNQFNAKKHGLIGGVSVKDLSEINFPLPPIDEQKKIVERIESLFSKLDSAKSIVQKILDGYELRRTAILHKAFTGELSKNFRAENNLSLDDWQEKTLGEVIKKIKYGSSAKSTYQKNNFPILRIPNIMENRIDFSDMKYLFKPDDSCQVCSNDILIVRSNGSRDLVGKCALIPEMGKNYFYASFLICISPTKSISAKFLSTYLNSNLARKQMFSKAKSSSGIHNINSKEIKSIKIFLPPLAEQKEIVRVLDSLLDKERRTKEIAEKILQEIDLLKKSVLARAFRGEL